MLRSSSVNIYIYNNFLLHFLPSPGANHIHSTAMPGDLGVAAGRMNQAFCKLSAVGERLDLPRQSTVRKNAHLPQKERKDGPMFRFPIRIAGLFAMLTLAACGGSDGDPASAPAASVRIEPHDTGPRSTAESTTPAALPRSRLVRATTVRLDPLDEEPGLEKKSQAAAADQAIPWQIGVPRSLAATATAQGTRAQLRWQPAPGGMQRAAISFTSEGAWGVRPGLLVRSLPANTTLRFYAQAGTDVIQVSGDEVLRTVQRNLAAGDTSDAARTYWVPDFRGAETTVELELPARANLAELDLAIPTLSHFFVSPSRTDTASVAKALGDGASCTVDVTCNAQYLDESRSVALMTYVRNGASYLCTGTLLNDVDSSGIPYFLSANHCISTQAEADTLTTDWFHHASACNSRALNAGTQRVTGGALLLHNDAATDISFMRLNAQPPEGSVYAGSYAGVVPLSSNVVGVHHPRGDLQKLSIGTITAYNQCMPITSSSFYCIPSNAQSGKFFSIAWNQGITEPGSSGSGLFHTIDGSRYLVGQLYGGSSRCRPPSSNPFEEIDPPVSSSSGKDFYGRFDLPFHSVLKNWLNPD
ncbi:endoproteinase ArgC [Verminephrobacter aporrectodeae subsp. tuberculatae]|nr:endoproteinase ArgC [Verminephrobacter aporrectodeae subsp. tuberculatae]